MTEYLATTPGLFPLPDWSKDALADLKGHQKHDLISGDEGEPVLDVYDEARAEVVGLQAASGLDLVVEGQLRWDDMLAHPLCVNPAVEPGGLVRYYDNNNFYRDPVVTGPLSATGDIAADLEAAAAHTDSLQAVVPGPYSLAALATDDHYGDEGAFLEAIAGLLAAEVEDVPALEAAFLLEPSLVTDPPQADRLGAVTTAIDRVADAFEAPVVVHTSWGAPEPALNERLVTSGIDAVGYDLVTDADAVLDVVSETGTPEAVALGVVDGQNTLVESPSAIRDRIDRFEAAAGDHETVYLTSNTELFYLPIPKFEAKLDALGTALAEEAPA